MSRAEIIGLVALASGSFPSIQSRDPLPVVAAWSLLLADLPFELAKAAVIMVCRESQFFPSVAQIVAAAAVLGHSAGRLPTAAEAWAEVSEQIQSCGPYRSPVYSCETVRRAVRALGWRQLCCGDSPEADRAHFLRIYESMRGKAREAEQAGAAARLAELTGASEGLAAGLPRQLTAQAAPE